MSTRNLAKGGPMRGPDKRRGSSPGVTEEDTHHPQRADGRLLRRNNSNKHSPSLPRTPSPSMASLGLNKGDMSSSLGATSRGSHMFSSLDRHGSFSSSSRKQSPSLMAPGPGGKLRNLGRKSPAVLPSPGLDRNDGKKKGRDTISVTSFSNSKHDPKTRFRSGSHGNEMDNVDIDDSNLFYKIAVNFQEETSPRADKSQAGAASEHRFNEHHMSRKEENALPTPVASLSPLNHVAPTSRRSPDTMLLNRSFDDELHNRREVLKNGSQRPQARSKSAPADADENGPVTVDINKHSSSLQKQQLQQQQQHHCGQSPSTPTQFNLEVPNSTLLEKPETNSQLDDEDEEKVTENVTTARNSSSSHESAPLEDLDEFEDIFAQLGMDPEKLERFQQALEHRKSNLVRSSSSSRTSSNQSHQHAVRSNSETSNYRQHKSYSSSSSNLRNNNQQHQQQQQQHHHRRHHHRHHRHSSHEAGVTSSGSSNRRSGPHHQESRKEEDEDALPKPSTNDRERRRAEKGGGRGGGASLSGSEEPLPITPRGCEPLTEEALKPMATVATAGTAAKVSKAVSLSSCDGSWSPSGSSSVSSYHRSQDMFDTISSQQGGDDFEDDLDKEIKVINTRRGRESNTYSSSNSSHYKRESDVQGNKKAFSSNLRRSEGAKAPDDKMFSSMRQYSDDTGESEYYAELESDASQLHAGKQIDSYQNDHTHIDGDVVVNSLVYGDDPDRRQEVQDGLRRRGYYVEKSPSETSSLTSTSTVEPTSKAANVNNNTSSISNNRKKRGQRTKKHSSKQKQSQPFPLTSLKRSNTQNSGDTNSQFELEELNEDTTSQGAYSTTQYSSRGSSPSSAWSCCPSPRSPTVLLTNRPPPSFVPPIHLEAVRVPGIDLNKTFGNAHISSLNSSPTKNMGNSDGRSGHRGGRNEGNTVIGLASLTEISLTSLAGPRSISASGSDLVVPSPRSAFSQPISPRDE